MSCLILSINMNGLTKRQKEIAEFIENYLSEKKTSPSFREIKQHFGFSSLGSVYNFIQTLKRKKVLAETKGVRALSLQKSPLLQIEVPLVGKLRGKMALEMFPHISTMALPSHMISQEGEHYLLQVEGHELLEEFIQDKDLILVKPSKDFDDGEVVIISVEEATFVKRAYSDPPYIRLESANPHLQPLILREEHIQIHGIVLSLLRNLT